MGLRTEIRASVALEQDAVNDFGGAIGVQMLASLSLADGAGAGQANHVWADQRTVASGANDDIDLRSTLEQLNGALFAPTSIVALFLRNAPIDPGAAANTTNLTIGGGTNPVVGLFGTTSGAISPGGAILLFAGAAGGLCAVTAATADILRVANSAGASATYQIALICRGA